MPVGSITTKLSSFSIFCKKGKYFSVDFAPVRPALGPAGFGVKAPEVKTPAELDAAMDKVFDDTPPDFPDVITQPEVAHQPPFTAG
jgi:thiamine pyrophosphate-dependent acetolactate synthase large subunit-like protein